MTVKPNEEKGHYKVPGDLNQLPIVWGYELLKYLRSWRIIASIAIVVAMLSLLYIVPPALGSPYSGTDRNEDIWVEDISYLNITFPGMPQLLSFGTVNRSVIDIDSLQLFVNGTPYPSTDADGLNWVFQPLSFADELPSFMGGAPKVNALLFTEDLTGSNVTATYSWSTSKEDFGQIFLGFANMLIIICATFFAADTLVGEFQNRTGYLIFPNPLKREVLFLGKFSASLTAGILIVSLYYIGLAVMSFATVGGVDDDFLLSLAFALEFLLAATSVGYLISSVLKGSTGSTVLTFLMFVIIMPIVDGVTAFAGVKLEASLTFASNTMAYVVMDPYPVDTSVSMMGYTIYSYYPTPHTAAIVMLGYTVICLAVSLFLFRRKQLSG